MIRWPRHTLSNDAFDADDGSTIPFSHRLLSATLVLAVLFGLGAKFLRTDVWGQLFIGITYGAAFGITLLLWIHRRRAARHLAGILRTSRHRRAIRRVRTPGPVGGPEARLDP